MHDHGASPPLSIDDFASELQRLRTEADTPSYAELAARIGRARETAGDPAARARVARSTVYDVFRTGRRRLDVQLVREVLVALGLDDDAVVYWTAVARTAVPVDVPAAPVDPVTDGAEAAEPEPEPEPDAGPDRGPVAEQHRAEARRGDRLLLVLFGCIVGNLAGRALVDLLGLPLHLDMVWTAVAAILLGPWWGALVGVSTNGIGALISGSASLPFALVNVTGALVWGYGVRRFGLGRTIPRFFALNVICAVACSVVATAILIVFFDATLGPQGDRVSDRVADLTQIAVLSVFLPNLIFSLADKIVSGFVALAVVEGRSSAAARTTDGTPAGPTQIVRGLTQD